MFVPWTKYYLLDGWRGRYLRSLAVAVGQRHFHFLDVQFECGNIERAARASASSVATAVASRVPLNIDAREPDAR